MLVAIDTGILVAITNSDENKNRRDAIITTLNELFQFKKVVFFTNISVVTEAFYLCHKSAGISGSVALEANMKKYNMKIFENGNNEDHLKNYSFLLDQNFNVDFYIYTSSLLHDAETILTVDSKDLFLMLKAFDEYHDQLPYRANWARLKTEDIRVFNC